MDYRHELKYVVTAAELALLENRIKGLGPAGRACGSGRYVSHPQPVF